MNGVAFVCACMQSKELPELLLLVDLLLRRWRWRVVPAVVAAQEASGAELLILRAAAEEALLLLLLLPVPRGVRRRRRQLRVLRAVPALLVRLHLRLPALLLLRVPQVQRRLLRPALLPVPMMMATRNFACSACGYPAGDDDNGFDDG